MRRKKYGVALTLAVALMGAVATAQSSGKTATAILYPVGTVYVNGISVAGPTAVYWDDKITTGSGSLATITDSTSGKSMGIGSGASYNVDGTTARTFDSHPSWQSFKPKRHRCWHSSPDPYDKDCCDTDAVAPQDSDSRDWN